LIGSKVPITNKAINAMIATHSGPIQQVLSRCPARYVTGVTSLVQWPSQ
jgi:hypothetical protein